ncbi:MAG: ABC transporter substrate-binding protein [Spirochaetota bacterium]
MKRKLFVFLVACLALTFFTTFAFAGGGKEEAVEEEAPAEAAEIPWKKAPDVWGDEVNIMALKATVSQPLFHFADIWEKERGRGTKVKITEVPIEAFHQKIFTDLITGMGQYDAYLTATWFTGDYFSGDQYIYDIEQFMDDPQFPQWDPDTVVPAMKTLYSWAGKWVGVPNDNDGQVMYYRKDILTNKEYQQRFKDEMGYDLPVPPKTTRQFLDVAKFFNGWDWDNDGEKDYGVTMHLKVGAQGMFHYMSWAAPYVISDQNDRFWFNAETFEPLINSPGHVKALEDLTEMVQYGPEGMIGWTLGEAWDLFLKGDAVLTYTWGDLGSLAQDEEESVVKGKLGAAIMPGTTRAYDPIGDEWVEFDEPNRVGNTTGGSWHGVISVYSDAPRATYDYLAFMAKKENAFWNFTRGWTGVDPGRTFAFLEPHGTASVEDYEKQGWNAQDVREYTDAYWVNFTAEKQFPYLMIPGTNEYWRALDVEINKVASGQKEAKEAMDDTYDKFQSITSRHGKENQLRLFRQSFNLQ